MATLVKPITTEFGHSLPPEGPHTITIHGPGWDTALRFRDGDPTIFARLKSIYPRFFPFGPVRQLSVALAQKLGADPSQEGVLMFTDPETFTLHRIYSISNQRKEHKLAEGDLSFRVVDVHNVRLYCVVYPLPKMPGAIGIWQNAGIGLSSRASDELLGYLDSGDFAIVEWPGEVLSDVPPASYLPECEAHGALRKRIRDLLHRAPVNPAGVQVGEGDVYLYQTGMAAIWRLNQVLLQRDDGTILVLGSVFHNTFHLLEETTSGMKHFGACDAKSRVMEKVEEYLEAHYKAGKTISYVFVEFPSNPILVSADLKRLHQIADKYGFPVVIDDTIGSFANIDVLPVADLIITSLTKSFSGYADVMGGSVVLNPLSPLYPQIKAGFTANFHNEFFAGDAEQLLSNSEDYIPRSTTLNRNAAAIAGFLAAEAARPDSPIKAVLYPSTSDTQANYEAFMRPTTPDFTSGYGCLLSVDFRTLPAAAAFYDNLPVHQGPHLGAHRTLAIPMNALAYGKDPEQVAYHAAYGAAEEQVRISVGLEDGEELVAAVKEALVKATEVYNGNTTEIAQVSADEVMASRENTGDSEAGVETASKGTSANYN